MTAYKTDENNYRLVSLSSGISKVIGKTVYDRLYRLLEQNKKIAIINFDLQSNTRALGEITEKVKNSFDKSFRACGECLDLKRE